MQTESAHFPATPIASKMGVAIGIGMLAGMEREWSNKDVGIRTLHSRHLIGRHAIHLHALHMSHAAHSDIGHCANGIWIHGRDLCRHTRSRRQGTARISTARLRLRQDGACDFLVRLNDTS